jgi:hypothetical protein
LKSKIDRIIRHFFVILDGNRGIFSYVMRKIPDVFIFKKLWYKIYGGCLLYCRQNGQKIYRDFGDFFVVGVENGVGGGDFEGGNWVEF